MKKALLQMHLAVFLWGFTGVLGRAIQLDAYPMMWYRTLLTACMLLLILLFRKEKFIKQPKELLRFAAIGSVIAIHWVAFYAAIKYANASIALICLATAGIFTSLLEPLVSKSRFDYREFVVGLIALIGMYCIYAFDVHFATGILLGLTAALLSSFFTVLNKRIVSNYSPFSVAFYEIGFGFLFLCLLFPVYHWRFPGANWQPSRIDLVWLIVLSFFCTVLGQSLAISALKKLSSFTTVLMVNLEPVYGIILAMIFYQENKELGLGFYLGIVLIAGSVALHTLNVFRGKSSH